MYDREMYKENWYWRGRRVQGMETGELGPVRFIAVLSLMYEADLGLTG